MGLLSSVCCHNSQLNNIWFTNIQSISKYIKQHLYFINNSDFLFIINTHLKTNIQQHKLDNVITDINLSICNIYIESFHNIIIELIGNIIKLSFICKKLPSQKIIIIFNFNNY